MNRVSRFRILSDLVDLSKCVCFIYKNTYFMHLALLFCIQGFLHCSKDLYVFQSN